MHAVDPGIFEAWLASTDDGVVAVDAEGRVVLHNPAASRVTGLAPTAAHAASLARRPPARPSDQRSPLDRPHHPAPHDRARQRAVRAGEPPYRRDLRASLDRHRRTHRHPDPDPRSDGTLPRPYRAGGARGIRRHGGRRSRHDRALRSGGSRRAERRAGRHRRRARRGERDGGAGDPRPQPPVGAAPHRGGLRVGAAWIARGRAVRPVPPRRPRHDGRRARRAGAHRDAVAQADRGDRRRRRSSACSG